MRNCERMRHKTARWRGISVLKRHSGAKMFRTDLNVINWLGLVWRSSHNTARQPGAARAGARISRLDWPVEIWLHPTSPTPNKKTGKIHQTITRLRPMTITTRYFTVLFGAAAFIMVLLILGVGLFYPRAVRASGAGWPECGLASVYPDQGTASGERMVVGGLTAAHRTLPFGARVAVRSLAGLGSRSGVALRVEVRINDRGPFKHGRVIDLSTAAMKSLGGGYDLMPVCLDVLRNLSHAADVALAGTISPAAGAFLNSTATGLVGVYPVAVFFHEVRRCGMPFPCKINTTLDELQALPPGKREQALDFLVNYYLAVERQRADRLYERQFPAEKHPRRAALARSFGRGEFAAVCRAGAVPAHAHSGRAVSA